MAHIYRGYIYVGGEQGYTVEMAVKFRWEVVNNKVPHIRTLTQRAVVRPTTERPDLIDQPQS